MNEHASRPEMVPRIPPRGLALAGVLALLAAASPSPVDATRPPPIDVRAGRSPFASPNAFPVSARRAAMAFPGAARRLPALAADHGRSPPRGAGLYGACLATKVILA
jgi:hypothetical protein